MGNQLRLIGQLLRAGFSPSIYYTEIDGFDTHSAQLNSHSNRLQQVGTAVRAFIDDVSRTVLSREVLLLVFSEFEAIRQWECFDADTGKDLAREVREYFIPDFSRWKEHDAFEAGFARLLRDLKADESPAFYAMATVDGATTGGGRAILANTWEKCDFSSRVVHFLTQRRPTHRTVPQPEAYNRQQIGELSGMQWWTQKWAVAIVSGTRELFSQRRSLHLLGGQAHA